MKLVSEIRPKRRTTTTTGCKIHSSANRSTTTNCPMMGTSAQVNLLGDRQRYCQKDFQRVNFEIGFGFEESKREDVGIYSAERVIGNQTRLKPVNSIQLSWCIVWCFSSNRLAKSVFRAVERTKPHVKNQ